MLTLVEVADVIVESNHRRDRCGEQNENNDLSLDVIRRRLGPEDLCTDYIR